MKPARCRFYIRSEAAEGWYYDMVSLAGPSGSGTLITDTPPAVGDLIHLWDQSDRSLSGTFRVVDRFWMHSSWGSADWPYTASESNQGPLVDIIVERSDGAFVDQVLRPEDEE